MDTVTCLMEDLGRGPEILIKVAKVEAKGHTVRWTMFRNGHRKRDLSDLGPIEFPREKYEAALNSLGLSK